MCVRDHIGFHKSRVEPGLRIVVCIQTSEVEEHSRFLPRSLGFVLSFQDFITLMGDAFFFQRYTIWLLVISTERTLKTEMWWCWERV